MKWPFSKNKKVTLTKREYHSLSMKAALYAANLTKLKQGIPQWSSRDLSQLAHEGYKLNSIVFACINRIAKMFAAVEFEVIDRKTKKIVEGHNLSSLLERPNKMMSGFHFLETYATYYFLFGNAYQDATVFMSRDITELHLPKPFRIKCTPGKFGVPENYTHEVNAGVSRWFFDVNGNPDLGRSDDHMIMHGRTTNPTDDNDADWYGLSPLEAAGYATDQHNEASRHNKSLLENGMSPSGAFKYSPPLESGFPLTSKNHLLTPAFTS